MDVRVVVKLLVPCMENLDDSRSGAKVFRVLRKLHYGLSHASVEEAVQVPLVGEEKRPELRGAGEDGMVVRGVYDLRAPFVHPELPFHGTAYGAVPVRAGVVVFADKAAVAAYFYIEAAFFCAADADVADELLLLLGKGSPRVLEQGVSGHLEDAPDLGVRGAGHVRCGEGAGFFHHVTPMPCMGLVTPSMASIARCR